MSKIATPPGQSAARDVLSQVDAAARALRVSEVSYSIRLDFVAGQATYHGDVTIQFTTTGEEPLFLDFRGRDISHLMLNGTSIEPDWTGYRLTLPGEHLRATNELRIEYENDYDTTGDGLHRFVDPEDGSEYVYTNFEPYEAHRLFPCFDQPDLKATYEFSVTAPSTWRVISNAPLATSSPAEAGRTNFSFERTEVFSTYLTALVGGPYVERHVEHGGLHLALYARQSMERYLDEQAAEILEITGQGMDFFARLFDQPYPFAKYDQVFVPEYNSGAMENVGCVTYNEAYLFRDSATDQQRLDRAETFLHELAHMWFGNLVTMRWWDDLWLNESFATYISYLALTEATRFGDGAWKVFNSDIKRWAYQQDQLPTTHPISGTAADTEIAFLNFDGITYGKGASVLKQLVKHIGRDVFERGMQLYFRRHGWGNATLADFLGCLEDAGNISLAEWARLWLQTSSVNTLAASIEARDGRIAALAIEQTAPTAQGVLRPHTLEIAFARERAGEIVIDAVEASIDGPRAEVSAVAGRPLPEFVFPNHGDHAYAKVELDQRSLAYVRANLGRVADPLLRNLLWASLWEMVRDQRLRSPEFLAIARAQLQAESDLDILEIVLDRVAWTVNRYLPASLSDAEAHAWFEFAMDNLANAPAGDAQVLWARSAINVATSRADVQRLAAIVVNGEMIGAFELDQEMRWSIAVLAVVFALPEADAMLTHEAGRDPSDRGRRALLKADAARPTPAAKEAAWQRIHGEGYGSFHLTRAAMQGFFWPQQAELLEPYVGRFFEEVHDVFAKRDHPFARSYLISLFPAHMADPDVLERARVLLGGLNGSLPTLTRQLAEASDELDRQIKIREYAAAG